MESLYIIKVGGNVIDDASALDAFLNDFALIRAKKILVHGGGKIATSMSARLGIETKMQDGRRITSAEDLDVVTMVYAGLINKNIVAKLQRLQCNAIGLCGADFNLIPAKKRKMEAIDYGFVGDISQSDIPKFHWKLLLDAGTVPVIAPITHDNNGQLLNTNADTIATTIAMALSKQYEVKLIYCFEKPGVLLNADDDTSLVKSIKKSEYEQLKEKGIVHSGMLPKLENAFTAVGVGVQHVHIVSAKTIKSITESNVIQGTKVE